MALNWKTVGESSFAFLTLDRSSQKDLQPRLLNNKIKDQYSSEALYSTVLGMDMSDFQIRCYGFFPSYLHLNRVFTVINGIH